jgi:hypothetical protein
MTKESSQVVNLNSKVYVESDGTEEGVHLWVIEMVNKTSGDVSVRYRPTKHEAQYRKARAGREGCTSSISQVVLLSQASKYDLCNELNKIESEKNEVSREIENDEDL